MLVGLFVLFLLVGEHRVSASTELLSWQLDGNSRSAWDILWSCSTTIFACTWTILHPDVPGRQVSEARRTVMYCRTWLLALFVPEVILGYAFLEFAATLLSQARYNEAQERRNSERKVHGLDEGPVDQGQSDLVASRWTLAQTFCVNAGGLVLQTPDGWMYTVGSEAEMILLIQTGLASPCDLREQDIQAHAKQDWLGKLFTLVQVSWFLCNVVARWAYQLSVSPFELATFAYCLLAIFIYAFWWCKPKDVDAPITVPLNCSRDDLPTELLDTMVFDGWIHRRTPAKEEKILSVTWNAIMTPFLAIDGENFESIKERAPELSNWLHLIVLLGGFTGIAYSGIHLAAWDFAFPTQAEWVAWITFSFTALGAVSVFNTVNSIFNLVGHMRSTKKVPSSMDFLYEEDNWNRTFNAHLLIKQVMMSIYIVARLGIMALVCSSLRALPEDSYTAVEWVTSIPHF